MLRSAIVAVMIVAGVSGNALAGEGPQLTQLAGSVVVNRGGQFSPGARGALQPGDRVVVADGVARVAYPDGCVAEIKARSMLTVSTKSPCRAQSGLVTTGPAVAQAANEGVTALQWGGIALAGVAIIAGIAAAADDLALSN